MQTQKDQPQVQGPSGPRRLDARTWSGPWCLLKIISHLKRLPPGGRLEVWVKDPMAVAVLPRLLPANDSRLVQTRDHGGYHSFLIQRGRDK